MHVAQVVHRGGRSPLGPAGDVVGVAVTVVLVLHGAELLHERPLVARHAVDDDVEGHGVQEPHLQGFQWSRF